MNDVIMSINGLKKTFGGVCATDDVSFDIVAGEIHAIIGPNGAGKTTLISQLSGGIFPDTGNIIFNGHDITGHPVYRRAQAGLARSFQITSLLMHMSVLDNVALAVQAHDGHSYHFWKPARKERHLRDKAMAVIDRVGLGYCAHRLIHALSHGERRQVEIAVALATGPILLLLDEPMAGMGLEESSQMIETLRSFSGELTMVLVEHDMDAVFALADRISVLVYGRRIMTGTPEEVRSNAEVRHAYLGDG